MLASIAVGVAMFGTTVFLTQYMQIARAKSPTESGLLTIPMVGGLLIASIVVGRRVTRTGVYKPYMITGATLLTLGLLLMGTLDETTHSASSPCSWSSSARASACSCRTSCWSCRTRSSSGTSGAGSALVAFMRSLGGAVGVSALGALLAHHATTTIAAGLADLGVRRGAAGGNAVPDVGSLPAPVAHVVEHGYGTAIGEIFLVAAPLGLLVVFLMLSLPAKPLGQRSGIQRAAETGAAPA